MLEQNLEKDLACRKSIKDAQAMTPLKSVDPRYEGHEGEYVTCVVKVMIEHTQ